MIKEKILQSFTYNKKLKFNEIEKAVKERSNKLSYHLKRLEDKGIIEKEDESYRLSDNSECLIPYLTEKKSVLPVILIELKDGEKRIFLIKREKRPYKGMFGLPGGRIILGETISKAAERIMREKFNIKCKFKKINSISLEHVKKKNKIVHSFLLILVTAITNEKVNYKNIYKYKSKMIKSDYNIIKNNVNSKVNIKEIHSKV